MAALGKFSGKSRVQGLLVGTVASEPSLRHRKGLARLCGGAHGRRPPRPSGWVHSGAHDIAPSARAAAVRSSVKRLPTFEWQTQPGAKLQPAGWLRPCLARLVGACCCAGWAERGRGAPLRRATYLALFRNTVPSGTPAEVKNHGRLPGVHIGGPTPIYIYIYERSSFQIVGCRLFLGHPDLSSVYYRYRLSRAI